MSDYRKYVLITFVTVCVIAFLGIIFSAFGVSPGNGGEDVPKVKSLQVLDSDSSETERYKNITREDNGTYSVKGRIVGSMGGGEVVVESVGSDSESVEVHLKVESSGIGTTVITGYEYSMKVKGVDDRELSVVHDSSSSVDNSFKESNGEPTAELIGSSSSSTTTETSSVSFDANKTLVEGVIVGNTGGQEVVVNGVENRDGMTYLNIGLEVSDGFATQVITGYSYDVEVSNSADTVVVQHDGETVGNYERNGDTTVESYDYDFHEGVGSSTVVAELVEENGGSFAIEGSFVTGSSSCNEASLSSVNVEDGIMTVNLSFVSNPPISGGCTEDLGSSNYRLEVNSADGIQTVVVEADQKVFDTVRKQIDL